MPNSPDRKPGRKKRPIVFLDDDQRSNTELAVSELKLQNPQSFNLPTTKRSVEDLTQYFLSIKTGTTRILPKEKRRYVIYLRKSTDDEAKQVRSLDDQLTECLQLAKTEKIIVREEDIIQESASAKKSGKRPLFDKMIEGFKLGKYHGLIAWSPDRLSRNMKEAGEIIEMIDLEQIQDLLFKTYQFENNPNGKMLLGILFATSKQYSDKLSVDVSRGTDGNIQEGKYNGSVKRGYYADRSTGFFIPDGTNWELLRYAVNMRLHDNKSNVEIAEFLNNAHFSTRKNQDELYRLHKFTDKRVGELFDDPFYFGLYQYGDNLANLTELYDFLPLITPDEYIQLNGKVATNFNAKSVGRTYTTKRLEYGLLRNKVICDYCDTVMQFQHQEIQRGVNQGKWLISFYCRNKGCQRYKTAENKANGTKLAKSVRAKYVMAHIEYTLRNCTVKSKAAYRLYSEKISQQVAQEKAIAHRKLQEAKADLKAANADYVKYQSYQVDYPEDYKRHHTGKLEHYQNVINVAEQGIKNSLQELERLKTKLPTEAEFYELTNSYLFTLLNTTDLLEQDAVCNELVSNLRAGNDCVSVIKLNKPYDLLLNLSEMSIGRDGSTGI